MSLAGRWRRRRGRVATLGAVAVFVVVWVLNAHRYLATTALVRGEILVVEGWIWNKPALRKKGSNYNIGMVIHSREAFPFLRK